MYYKNVFTCGPEGMERVWKYQEALLDGISVENS